MEEHQAKVTCAVCQAVMTAITNTHLKKHNLTVAEYKVKYPTAQLISDHERERASKHAKRVNKPGVARPGVGAKISATKQAKIADGYDYGAKLRGVCKSDEHKQSLSDSVKQSYVNGQRLHYMIGKAQPDAVKAQIAATLIQYHAPFVAERELHKHESLLCKAMEAEERAKQLLAMKADKLCKSNIVVQGFADNTVTFTCTVCKHSWSMTAQYLDNSRLDKVVCRQCNPKQTTSQGELELLEFVRSLEPDVISGDREILGGRELDVLVPNKRVAFEYNGLYWHAESVRGSPKHLLWKQQHAYNMGYSLYHIFEDEWLLKQPIVKSKIKAILGKLDVVHYARKLQIVRLSDAEKAAFLVANHLQGNDVSGIRYGLLTSDGQLVACATFKRTSFVKGGNGKDFELSRYATLCNTSVVGGAGKLIAAFIKDYQPKRLISYADRRWSYGKLYKALGFKFENFSAPSYWYMHGYKDRKHRSAFMKHELVAQGHDANKTEWEIMQGLGYDRIWDCGTLKYVLELNSSMHD